MKTVYKYIFVVLGILVIKFLFSLFTGYEFKWWITIGFFSGYLLVEWIIDKNKTNSKCK